MTDETAKELAEMGDYFNQIIGRQEKRLRELEEWTRKDEEAFKMRINKIEETREAYSEYLKGYMEGHNERIKALEDSHNTLENSHHKLASMVRALVWARSEAEDVATGTSALADIVFQLNSLEDTVNGLVKRMNKA